MCPSFNTFSGLHCFLLQYSYMVLPICFYEIILNYVKEVFILRSCLITPFTFPLQKDSFKNSSKFLKTVLNLRLYIKLDYFLLLSFGYCNQLFCVCQSTCLKASTVLHYSILILFYFFASMKSFWITSKKFLFIVVW